MTLCLPLSFIVNLCLYVIHHVTVSACLMSIHQFKLVCSLTCEIFCRYRQILDKAIQFTDADQLESLKAFVEASMLPPQFFLHNTLCTFGCKQDI